MLAYHICHCCSTWLDEICPYFLVLVSRLEMGCGCSSLLDRVEPVVGFCFSFPVEQTSVSSGKLLRWTKGYTNPGAVGSDPAKLLGDAFRRRVRHIYMSCCST